MFIKEKLLVTTGFPFENGTRSEVIDLVNDLNKCDDLPDYPLQVEEATGGFISGKYPMICGGHFYTYDQCLVLGSDDLMVQLLTSRTESASVVLNNKLWITGGLSGSNDPIETTEFVDLSNEESQRGIDLPEPMYSHCLAKIDDNHALLTGGMTMYGSRRNTYLFSEDTNGWIRGPDMIQGRSEHTCGSFYSEFHSATIAIVAGGQDRGSVLDSVEILVLNSGQWIEGPKLLKPLYAAAMVPLRHSVVVIGGVSGINEYQSSIHSLSCNEDDCQWTTLKQELKVPRMQSVAMMIPDSLTNCKVVSY